jgi:hypothetical protein
MASRDELLESILNAARALPSPQQIQFLEQACSDSKLREDSRRTLLALIEKSRESQVPKRRLTHRAVGTFMIAPAKSSAATE